ncbi:MAG: PQQ-binding-like beta-propeller repeat protein [Acidobacteriota bacterium]
MVRPWLPLVALLALVAPAAAQPRPSPSSGSGTIYVGSYSGHLTAVDEATGTFTKIPLKTGAPYVVRLSPDRTRFYVESANEENFEVVDVRRRETLDTFTLSSGARHVRVLAFEVDPQHRTMVVVTKPATKLIDRWEIGAPEFIVYDLATHKVVRTVPWTIDPEPTHFSVALRFSPDGKLLYVFGDQVTILDAATMETVDTWDLSRPDDPAMGRFEPGPWDDAADPEGTVTSLFTMRDAVMNRKLLVVGEVNLGKRTVAVFPIGPEPATGSLSFTMSPDRRFANVLRAEIGHHELWTIDMAQRRVTNRVDVPTRTRMQMRTSSTGLLYIYEAGRTIEVYAADASKRLRTIELDSDMMYGTFVIVPPGPAPH